MDKFEQTTLRISFLKQFDEYVRDVINDDDITNYWLGFGWLPENYTYDNLLEIAKDDNLWLDCVKTFARCCINIETEKSEVN